MDEAMQPMAIDLETREAFGALLERHRGILFKIANSWSRLPEDRADLIQEIAMQLWRAWPQYDPARNFSTWMYRIALNVAISFGRGDGRRRRHLVPLDDGHDIADHNAADHETEQQIELLQRFIRAQKPLDRALLILYLDERPQREIADILGISEANVSTKIGRLKQRIRNEL
jgi:RNA polymerase sigma-70 factor (ECF subfamily)